jgi:hypothetical protein
VQEHDHISVLFRWPDCEPFQSIKGQSDLKLYISRDGICLEDYLFAWAHYYSETVEGQKGSFSKLYSETLSNTVS